MWFVTTIILLMAVIVLVIDDLRKTDDLHAKTYELAMIEKGLLSRKAKVKR